MLRCLRCCLLVALCAALLSLASITASRLQGQEPWADQSLPATAGAALWLDASVQPQVWSSHDTRGLPLADGRPLDVWFDGSGNKRHFLQRAASSQPTFRTAEEHAYVSFDGVDDFLFSALAGSGAEDFTIFMVTAPQSNGGAYRAWISGTRIGKNDYVSGFNVDQGGASASTWQCVSVEGDGFGGQTNLMADPLAFGDFHLLEVVAGGDAVEVVIDGRTPGLSRTRQRRELGMDEMAIGARLYSNGPQPSFAQGFFDGQIAELLVFETALSAEQRGTIRSYLLEKYQDLNEAVRRYEGRGGHPLETLEDPPVVQVLIPGFDVQELPLDLPNINNVLYRSDGQAYALAYDGDVYLLSDTDGDGLEDHAEVFWASQGSLLAPIGMDLTPDDYPRGRGLFVASKGKVSLVVDQNGDDRADEETVVAGGWTQLPHGVDALGVAYDQRDGSIYFGLGAKNFVNAYQIGSDAQGGYRLDDERGTVLRVAPDFKSRQIVATGIRFPVAMRFNPQGDLFCTDQEGATWLPNGNPLDELLHIQTGRHYGFPPRHPKFLPDVIDEPSIFDYGPQHQSTCGLNFNEPLGGGKTVGPDWWRGDAIVTGYSRGKLYRTSLVKTPAGYVAQNHLLACLNALTVDACVSPSGDLLIATHSGGPDWGSGPAGRGKLFKLAYRDRDAAQPVFLWPANKHEVRIAFDRPLRWDDVKALLPQTQIEHGDWVRAGDRFETVRPGYAVVQMQMASRRFDLPVQGIQVTPDLRTLILNTAEHPAASHYAVTLPWKQRKPSAAGIQQRAELDLHYTLHGSKAVLRADDGVLWEGWLPHIDLAASRAFTRGSSQHEQLWEYGALDTDASEASLTLRTQLELSHLLHAEVQQGSKLDFDYPPEVVTLELRSNHPLEVSCERAAIEHQRHGDGDFIARVLIRSPGETLVPLQITLGGIVELRQVSLHVAWGTQEDERLRPLALRRMFVPWAARKGDTNGLPKQLAARPAELEGGSWGRGRQVFFGEKAMCGKCHQVGGQGGAIGPDLSNLIHRDYASVKRDIEQPSYAINPDHLSHNVRMSDGRVFAGVVRSQGDRLIIGDRDGRETAVQRDEIEEIVASSVSIMPEDLHKQIGPAAMRDLMTFLLTPSPSMPNDLDGAPEPRTLEEVQSVLAGAAEPMTPLRPLHLVLVAGQKDHGPGEHDYPAWLRVWGDLLEAAENVTVTRVMQWPKAEDFAAADALVFYQQGTWDDQRANDIDAFLKKGGGISYIHYAVDGGKQPEEFAERIGLAWRGGTSRFRHGELDLMFDSDHEIARNFRRVHLHDESYWKLVGDSQRTTLLASGREENVMQPLIWCRQQHQGRVFVSIPGHFSWTFDDPLFRTLLLRGIAWTAGESVDRFNDLVVPGARIEQYR